MAAIDTESLKSRFDLRDLAERYVTLSRASARESSGPCPKCKGTDRFHVTSDSFFCRQCFPFGNGRAHDVIAFVQWLGLAPDFRGAVAWLTGGTAYSAPPTPKVAPAKKEEKKPRWPEDRWQEEARRKLAEAVARLAGPDGEPGRAYLAGRGLLAETWQDWGLGFDPAKWDPAQERKRPAIVMPWHWGKRLCALKYRFVDAIEKRDRFTSKGGGEQRLYGLQMRQRAGALILIEGELNALSVWQAARIAGLGVDVVSFGAESAGAGHWAAELASTYRRVIVWTDEERRTRDAMTAIPGAVGLRSPFNLDANDLLSRDRLPAFLDAIIGGLAAHTWAGYQRETKDS